MRSLRDARRRGYEEQLGQLVPDALIPELRRARAGLRLPGPYLRPMSFGYISWIAFLVFYLVFGRVMVSFYMTTQVISAGTHGMEVALAAAEPEWESEERVSMSVVRGAAGGDPDNTTAEILSTTIPRDVCARHARGRRRRLRLLAAVRLHPGSTAAGPFLDVESIAEAGTSRRGCAPDPAGGPRTGVEYAIE